MGVIIDSTLFIEAERSGRTSMSLKANVSTMLNAEVHSGVSVLTLSEIAYGHALNERLSQNAKEALIKSLQTAYTIYPVSAEIALRAGRLNAFLRQNGTPLGMADVLIAATALELGFGVLTHNIRHFNYVPELRVDDAAAI